MENEFDQIQEARDVIIRGIAQTMEFYGLTPSIGRIYGVLYFAETPKSLDEIKDEVAMSKATVSNGLRELLDTDMITKVWKKGDRKDYYIAVKDFFKNFINFFVKQLRQERKIILKAYNQSLPALEEIANNGQSEVAKEKAMKDIASINKTKVYFDWTLHLTDALETGEIFNYLPLSDEDEPKKGDKYNGY
ncbi:transcriptional regulator [Lentibacillus cibarius]|uniref:HTH-type transcriptional regulator n=1 Tax=Lentibacillus cibarius TaxID=2583219 RepID=A0A5S3QJA3_9BACI|nr:transcriptional regulator [Lentibacillus cibarius]TMN21807.1 transcriptional regulator [Lentibacillus cibarius]